MKKYLLLVFLSCIVTLFSTAQTLDDISMQIIPLQGIYKTQFGYVVHYTTNDVRFGQLFLPAQWFQPLPQKDTDITPKAAMLFSEQNTKNPQLKITYASGRLKKLLLLLPVHMDVTGIFDYSQVFPNPPEGRKLDDLGVKFEEQLNASYMIFEEYKRAQDNN